MKSTLTTVYLRAFACAVLLALAASHASADIRVKLLLHDGTPVEHIGVRANVFSANGDQLHGDDGPRGVTDAQGVAVLPGSDLVMGSEIGRVEIMLAGGLVLLRLNDHDLARTATQAFNSLAKTAPIDDLYVFEAPAASTRESDLEFTIRLEEGRVVEFVPRFQDQAVPAVVAFRVGGPAELAVFPRSVDADGVVRIAVAAHKDELVQLRGRSGLILQFDIPASAADDLLRLGNVEIDYERSKDPALFSCRVSSFGTALPRYASFTSLEHGLTITAVIDSDSGQLQYADFVKDGRKCLRIPPGRYFVTFGSRYILPSGRADPSWSRTIQTARHGKPPDGKGVVVELQAGRVTSFDVTQLADGRFEFTPLPTIEIDEDDVDR